MHSCQRFFQSSKHFSNLILGIAFSSFSNALLMSSMAVKRRPFRFLFVFGNRKKSHGAMSGEYRHTWICMTNMEAGASLQYCFWPNIHEHAMKCKQVHYRGAKATRFIPKTFEEISWHEPIDMPTSSATSFTFSTFS